MTATTKELDIVAIVPARGGSKRLPRKNVLPLAGKPLIQWTLDAAKESGVVDLIAVTSDDDEVLTIARESLVTAIRRPNHLASDTATSVDAVLHALEVLEQQGITAKRVMLLQPTSPLRRAEDIQAAVKRMDETGAASVISVCEVDHSPLWANTLPEDKSMDDFLRPEVKGKRSQDLPAYYRLNGAVYLFKKKDFLDKKATDLAPATSLIMSQERSIDIDSSIDFYFCEYLISGKKVQ